MKEDSDEYFQKWAGGMADLGGKIPLTSSNPEFLAETKVIVEDYYKKSPASLGKVFGVSQLLQ